MPRVIFLYQPNLSRQIGPIPKSIDTPLVNSRLQQEHEPVLRPYALAAFVETRRYLPFNLPFARVSDGFRLIPEASPSLAG